MGNDEDRGESAEVDVGRPDSFKKMTPLSPPVPIELAELEKAMQSYHSACELHKNRDFSIDTRGPVSSVGRMDWGGESPVSLSLRMLASPGDKSGE
jgi:hypothetical protein